MKAILSLLGSLVVSGVSAQCTTRGINTYNSNAGSVGIGTGTTFLGFKLRCAD